MIAYAHLLSLSIGIPEEGRNSSHIVAVASSDWSLLAFSASGIAGLGPHAFGPLVRSGEVIGTLQPSAASAHGLPAGIPVAMGAIDLLAAHGDTPKLLALRDTIAHGGPVGPGVAQLPAEAREALKQKLLEKRTIRKVGKLSRNGIARAPSPWASA